MPPKTPPVSSDKDKIKELHTKCTQLEKENKKQNKKIEDLKKQNSKKDDEIGRLNKTIELFGTEENVSERKDSNDNNRTELRLTSPNPANDIADQSSVQLRNLNAEIDRLKDDNTKLLQQVTNLKDEINRLEQKADKNVDVDKNSNKNKELQEMKAELNKKQTEYTEKVKQYEDKVRSLERQNSELQKTTQSLEDSLRKAQTTLEDKDKEWSEKMKINKQSYTSLAAESEDVTNLRKQIDDLTTELKGYKNAQKTPDNLQGTNSATKRDPESIKQLKESLDKQKEEKNKEIDDLKTRLEEEKQERSKLKTTVETLKSEISQLQNSQETVDRSEISKSANIRDLKQAESRMKQLQEDNKRLLEERNKAVKETDNLKNRLSQVAGSKLTDNNPAIADLSDPNRPLNLGEKFSELYDNQWTDAMEELESKGSNEKQSIQNLLNTVQTAYKFCLMKSKTYFNCLSDGIKKNFQTEELSSLQLKLLKDHRKSMAVHLVTDLQTEFCNKHKSNGEHLTAYQKQCITVCWFMVVQDPPVYLDDNEKVAGNKFDTDKYKHYTKTGKVADYLVWPILYLHKDGPMLGKGVAQGK